MVVLSLSKIPMFNPTAVRGVTECYKFPFSSSSMVAHPALTGFFATDAYQLAVPDFLHTVFKGIVDYLINANHKTSVMCSLLEGGGGPRELARVSGDAFAGVLGAALVTTSRCRCRPPKQDLCCPCTGARRQVALLLHQRARRGVDRRGACGVFRRPAGLCLRRPGHGADERASGAGLVVRGGHCLSGAGSAAQHDDPQAGEHQHQRPAAPSRLTSPTWCSPATSSPPPNCSRCRSRPRRARTGGL